MITINPKRIYGEITGNTIGGIETEILNSNIHGRTKHHEEDSKK